MTHPLVQPLALPCGVTLSNRLCKAAMSEGMADLNNNATPRLEALYRRWAVSGAGLLFSGNIQVDPDHLERPLNIVIHDESGQEQLARLAAAGRSGGAQFWAQLSHTGRQVDAAVNPAPLAPSVVGLDVMRGAGFNFAKPRAMTEAQIERAIGQFGFAARQVRGAGFTGVTLHAAHGYLISQYLSPLTNRRQDKWGRVAGEPGPLPDGCPGRRARSRRGGVSDRDQTRDSAFTLQISGCVNHTVRIPAPARGDVIGGPIRHSVPPLRDVMTAILVRFEWHGVRLGSGTSPPSYTVRSSPPNDRSVQQGRSEAEIRQVDLRVPGLRPYQRAGVSRRAQRTASLVRILTFLPSSRSTGGFTTTRSPALTPSLTSISVPRSRISVILCRRTTPFSTTNT
jgi:hypothetical protein